MNHYLLRFIETGRDAQRGKQPRDLASQLPGAQLEWVTGRLFVSTDYDATQTISTLHGVSSWSPCIPCDLQTLEAAVLSVDFGSAERFAVKIKRVGEHDFSSLELARKLAAALIATKHARVDLEHPQIVIGVEIREQRAWVYDRVHPGRDRHPTSQTDPLQVETPRFYADQMLGRLAAWLRMLGFDTTYAWDLADSEIVRRANAEGRVILTRDRPLSRNTSVRVYYVNARTVEAQVCEVIAGLRKPIPRSQLFQRCAVCNSPLQPLDKAAVADRVPPSAYAHHDRFAECRKCDKIYWAGSHYARVLAALGDLVSE